MTPNMENKLVSDKMIKRARRLLTASIKNVKYQDDPLFWYTDRWKGPAEDLDEHRRTERNTKSIPGTARSTRLLAQPPLSKL